MLPTPADHALHPRPRLVELCETLLRKIEDEHRPLLLVRLRQDLRRRKNLFRRIWSLIGG